MTHCRNHRFAASALAISLSLTLASQAAQPKPAAASKPAHGKAPAAAKPSTPAKPVRSPKDGSATDKKNAKAPHQYPSFGQVERFHPMFDELVPPGAKIEKLAEGFDWSEGPVWSVKDNSLFFSDVPRNIVYQWKPNLGTTEYLRPSGYSSPTARGGEPGSNGLTLDSAGRLVLCEHGDRRVSRLEKNGTKTTLAEFYRGRRLNSPNDLVYSRSGNLYFTDPPYGLEKGDKDPKKELVFNGVYLVRPTGQLVLLTDQLTYPNGIALSPDEKTLYVAVSDPAHPVIMAYSVKTDGTIDNGRIFFDATTLSKDRKGSPDGLKVDRNGNLFATGPGGILVICPKGTHLGTINTGEATANCAWGGDGSVLYITADMFLARIQTSTRGKGF